MKSYSYIVTNVTILHSVLTVACIMITNYLHYTDFQNSIVLYVIVAPEAQVLCPCKTLHQVSIVLIKTLLHCTRNSSISFKGVY